MALAVTGAISFEYFKLERKVKKLKCGHCGGPVKTVKRTGVQLGEDRKYHVVKKKILKCTRCGSENPRQQTLDFGGDKG